MKNPVFVMALNTQKPENEPYIDYPRVEADVDALHDASKKKNEARSCLTSDDRRLTVFIRRHTLRSSLTDPMHIWALCKLKIQ